MVYVLEWRALNEATSRNRALVSYLRVFRSVGAIKAFVRSRRFGAIAGPELRLSMRGAQRAGPIVTTVDNILAWNPNARALPAALRHPRWQTDLTALALSASISANVATELEKGRLAGILSDQQVRALLALLARALAGDTLAPATD